MPQSAAQDINARRFKGFLVLLAAVVVGAVAFQLLQRDAEELPPGVPRDAYDQAASEYRSRYKRSPSHMDTLSYLGELSIVKNDLELAASCFQSIPLSHESYGLSARLQLAHVMLKLNRASEAEIAFREFLTAAEESNDVKEADVVGALQWLSYLLSVELRLDERHVFLARLHELGQATVFESKQYYFPHLLLWRTVKGRERLREFLEQSPDDLQLLIAEGRYLIGEGRLDQARDHLEQLRDCAPDDRDCLAALLECHYERGDWQAFQDVLQTVPADVQDESWLLLLMQGEFARHRADWEDAARYFELLLEQEPAHVTACLGLSLAYSQLGYVEKSEMLETRTRTLSQIRPQLVGVTESDAAACDRLADQCESIGYADAAATFRRHAARIRGPSSTTPPTTPNATETVRE